VQSTIPICKYCSPSTVQW